ncbi:hypothetical protein ACFL3G_08770 [Planctomycetota bacterium]
MNKDTAPYFRHGNQKPQSNNESLGFKRHYTFSLPEIKDRLQDRSYDAWVIHTNDEEKATALVESLVSRNTGDILISDIWFTPPIDLSLLEVKKAKLKGGVTIDYDTMKVTYANKKYKRLPGGKVSKLLNLLLANNGLFLTQQQMFETHIWKNTVATAPNEDGKTVTVSLNRVRELIEVNPKKQKIIINSDKHWAIPRNVIVSIEYYDRKVLSQKK